MSEMKRCGRVTFVCELTEKGVKVNGEVFDLDGDINDLAQMGVAVFECLEGMVQKMAEEGGVATFSARYAELMFERSLRVAVGMIEKAGVAPQ